MKKIIFIACIVMFSTGIWADGTWKCANSIAELSCVKQENCKAKDTPLNTFLISINNNQQVSVCAKSKCWRGNTQAIVRGNYALYPIKQFNWTTLEKPNGEYTLAVNQSNQKLSIQGNGNIYQLQCIQA